MAKVNDFETIRCVQMDTIRTIEGVTKTILQAICTGHTALCLKKTTFEEYETLSNILLNLIRFYLKMVGEFVKMKPHLHKINQGEWTLALQNKRYFESELHKLNVNALDLLLKNELQLESQLHVLHQMIKDLNSVNVNYWAALLHELTLVNSTLFPNSTNTPVVKTAKNATGVSTVNHSVNV